MMAKSNGINLTHLRVEYEIKLSKAKILVLKQL